MANNHEINLRNIKKIILAFPKILTIFIQANVSNFTIISINSILQGFFPILQIIFLQKIINTIINSNSFNEVMSIFIFFSVYLIFREICNGFYRYSEGVFIRRLNIYTGTLLMDKANSLGLSDFENSEVQDKMKRSQLDASNRLYGIFSDMSIIISGLITLICSVIFMVHEVSWFLFFICLIPILSFYPNLLLLKEEYKIIINRTFKTREIQYYKNLISQDHAFKEIKLYKSGRFIINKFKVLSEEIFNQDKAILRKRLIVTLIFSFINILTIIFVIYIVVVNTMNDAMLIGTMLASIQTIILVNSTINNISIKVLSFAQNNFFINDFFGFLQTKSNDNYAIQLGTNRKLIKIKSIESIEFKKVSFKYPNSQVYSLKNISFRVRRGETIGIVGKNGSGKSTIIKLLSQLYPNYEGEILINNINIKDIDLKSYHENISVLFQDFMKYELTVKDNIAFGNPNAQSDDDRIYNSLYFVNLLQNINNMKDKLETRLGKWFPNGLQLSGGQWQRIAIARAYIRNSDLLVLDEPNSSLDPISENHVLNKYYEAVYNKIGVLISHRYRHVKNCDLILVMEAGEILESGNHEKLLENNRDYKLLFEQQAN